MDEHVTPAIIGRFLESGFLGGSFEIDGKEYTVINGDQKCWLDNECADNVLFLTTVLPDMTVTVHPFCSDHEDITFKLVLCIDAFIKSKQLEEFQ